VSATDIVCKMYKVATDTVSPFLLNNFVTYQPIIIRFDMNVLKCFLTLAPSP